MYKRILPLVILSILIYPARLGAELKVDINGVGGATQSGFVALNPTGTDSNTEYTAQVTIHDAFGAGLDATVSLHANRWKMRTTLTGSFVGQTDLLYDFGGPVGDPAKPPAEATLSLLLPQGIFDLLLYHHESMRTYPLDAYLILTDADGPRAQETVISSYGANPTAINTYSTTIRSDGSNAITFFFDNKEYYEKVKSLFENGGSLNPELKKISKSVV